MHAEGSSRSPKFGRWVLILRLSVASSPRIFTEKNIVTKANSWMCFGVWIHGILPFDTKIRVCNSILLLKIIYSSFTALEDSANVVGSSDRFRTARKVSFGQKYYLPPKYYSEFSVPERCTRYKIHKHTLCKRKLGSSIRSLIKHGLHFDSFGLVKIKMCWVMENVFVIHCTRVSATIFVQDLISFGGRVSLLSSHCSWKCNILSDFWYIGRASAGQPLACEQMISVHHVLADFHLHPWTSEQC